MHIIHLQFKCRDKNVTYNLSTIFSVFHNVQNVHTTVLMFPAKLLYILLGVSYLKYIPLTRQEYRCYLAFNYVLFLLHSFFFGKRNKVNMMSQSTF